MFISSKRGALHANQGFTMVELAVVVLVLGIVLTIATVTAKDVVEGSNYKRATSQIIYALKKARTMAYDGGLPVKVVFHNSTGDDNPSYEYFSKNEGGNWVDANAVSGGETASQGRIFFSDKMRFSIDEAEVVFHRRGVVMTATPVSFTVTMGSRTFDVAVENDGTFSVGGERL